MKNRRRLHVEINHKKQASAVLSKGDKLSRSKPKADNDSAKARPKKLNRRLNEEISSESENENDGAPSRKRKENEVEEEIEETPQEKKLRLAKLYLEQLREEEEKKAEEEDFESDLVAGRLREDVLEQKGKLQRQIGSEFIAPDPIEIRLLRGHKLSVTCLVITPDEKHIFSASKDCSIIKWDVESGKKVHKISGGRKGTEERHVGHTAHVLCMAISSDGKYLSTGDMNKLIMVWEAATCKHLYKFTGHKDAVSGLAFRRGTHDLYSASHDRSVKVWNVDENAYVETLFGHQDVITALDCLGRERCVTAGGRDRTLRIWKIAEETQLVFHGHDSIDCVQLINEEHMVSGGDDGSLCVWSVGKKKPVSIVKRAHGLHGNTGLEEPCWVSSVAALHNSDTLASGSHNAAVQLWKCGRGFRGLEPLFSVPVPGFVNSLKFSTSGKFLVAGVGQEHRLGRWCRIKDAKNGLYIIPLKRQSKEAEAQQQHTHTL
ncbi:U3 small nucleolar RNA-interacting protein 2 isoform X2 [Brachyhypopomus gauderio]|uniref:U3 small nucleolar RNA-interacting protein 2 isoform X2 n=1 Tax=Brachyhypopomus gauderio TaxID=698409 RepID=UPI004041EA61